MTPPDEELKKDTIDKMVRDFTSVVPRAKSEVRRRLLALVKEERERIVDTMLDWSRKNSDDGTVTVTIQLLEAIKNGNAPQKENP